jgi:hypothetical protein
MGTKRVRAGLGRKLAPLTIPRMIVTTKGMCPRCLGAALLFAGVLTIWTTPAGAVPGTTTRVSVDSAGNEVNTPSFWSSISANGRFVAFFSSASNLVPEDTNRTTDIFVHELMRKASSPDRDDTDDASVEDKDED